MAGTSLALVLLLGVARRAGYTAGAVYALLVWAVGEDFGGPNASGSTDVGTGIVYTIVFITLLAFASPVRRERFSLDRLLERRLTWWRLIADAEHLGWSLSSWARPGCPAASTAKDHPRARDVQGTRPHPLLGVKGRPKAARDGGFLYDAER